MTTFYEYDAQGWLIGWHEDAGRPSSTPIDFRPIPPAQARWNGTAWISDPSQAQAQDTATQAAATKQQQTLAALRAFDPATATASDVKNVIAAIIAVLRLTSN
jgi:hypothetical protein